MDSRVVFCIGLAVCGFIVLRPCVADNCKLEVRRSLIKESWQSSSFIQENSISTCFSSRSADEVGNWPFLHSMEGNESTDAGFHWFVIKLKQFENISSVSMKARTLVKNEHTSYGDNLNARAADIEVWTSQADLNFGSEHCNSKNINSVFQKAENGTWRLCGRTPTNVSSGQTLTVNCTRQKVRIVLLRKYITNETIIVRQCMNFVNMWINRAVLTTEFQSSSGKFPDSAEQNSSVTVQCNVRCPADFSDHIRLTGPSVNMTLGSKNRTHFIHNLQPSHAGNYSCRVGDEVASTQYLRVLYPPETLEITVDNSSCSEEPSGHVTFSFLSSSSDPKSEHQCSAFDSFGNNLTVSSEAWNKSFISSTLDSLTSHWKCLNCCQGENGTLVTLKCTAAQANVSWLPSSVIKTISFPSSHFEIYENASVNSSKTKEGNEYKRSIYINFLGLSIACTLILSVLIICFWRRKRAAPMTPPAKSVKPELSEEAVPLQQLSAASPEPIPSDNVTDANSDDGISCTYLSMMPKDKRNGGADAANGAGCSNSRPVSEVTLYQEIVADAR